MSCNLHRGTQSYCWMVPWWLLWWSYVLSAVPVHESQAKCYAYIYGKQKALSKIGVQMTYCNLETEDIRRFRKLYSMEELSAWFEKLCLEYQKWCDFEIRWKEKRQASIKKIEFPFPYREGQRHIARLGGV